MNPTDQLNADLRSTAPAAWRCLSPLGRRAIMPRGIVAQSAEASSSELNCTIGQITDGHGNAMPVDSLARHLSDLDDGMSHLYSPMAGHPALRQAWAERQRRLSGGSTAPASVDMVTLGLTQGVSHLAALFADEDTDVVVTDPRWGNYDHVMGFHAGARMVSYPYFRDDRFNVEGLRDALARVRGKAIVILNFPGNPTGYTPTPELAAQIVDVLTAHHGPAVVVVDDAYAGLFFEEGLHTRSLYWDLVEKADPERLFVVRLDGATKELLFFPGRIGFLTHPAQGVGAKALQNKLMATSRATVGSPPGPSQAMVYAALQNPKLEDELAERVALLQRRCRLLRQLLDDAPTDRLSPYPFNSGCFALVGVEPSVDAEQLRLRLLRDYDVGVIAIPSVNAIRLAYCSIAEENLPEVVARVSRAVDAV